MARKDAAPSGTVTGVRPVLREARLKVKLRVDLGGGSQADAWLPERETAALLPRSLLAGEARELPLALLDTLATMLERLAGGRRVRLWEYRGERYASFLSWRPVRFQEPGEPALEQDAEGHGHVQGTLRPG